MTHDWTPTDAADAADTEADRQWWRKPDPFDPQNAPDAPECSNCGETDFSPSVEAFEVTGRVLCDLCAEDALEDDQ